MSVQNWVPPSPNALRYTHIHVGIYTHTCNHSDSTGYTKDVALGEFHANQKWRERRVPILQVKWDF